MHPLDLAESWNNSRSPIPFETIFRAHLDLGTVILTPTSLLLARRVSSTWSDSQLCQPYRIDPTGDALHIWLLIGPPCIAWRSLIPAGVHFLTYHRGTRIIRRKTPS